MKRNDFIFFYGAADRKNAFQRVIDHEIDHFNKNKESYDIEAASLMGINVNNIISMTFAIGSALAGAAGVLVSLAFTVVEPYMGMIPGLKAFIAAVLGGIGSIPGALVGGLLIGLIETLTKGYISTILSDAIVFGILIIILLVKPTGLLGKKISEKV